MPLREFVLYSRTGQTDGRFRTLRDAGRLDTVYQCILTSIFVSHGIRKDVRFHAFLNGPPSPPKHITVDGASLHDVRVDEDTWREILSDVLKGRPHPGLSLDPTPFQNFIHARAEAGSQIFVLEEKGEDIRDAKFGENHLFILGDHVGLPKNEERYALRYGRKMSLGKERYLAASCVDIINHEMDRRSI